MPATPLTLGITTYNRRPLLEIFARSLAQVQDLKSTRVLVLDDCSQEYDADYLRRLFPQAQVFRAEQNSGGADYAMHRLFEHFVRSGDGYLLNLDADLLLSRRLVRQCQRIIEAERKAPHQRPCLYSVFNTASHPAIGSDDGFLLKRSVGAAATLWSRALLVDVLQHVPPSGRFDWDWSAYLTGRGVPIRVTPRSYVQHLGRVGQNTRSFVGMDHGEGFDDYTDDNLASFVDQTRDGLLKMLAEQQGRIDHQHKTIEQILLVIQSQAQVIQQLIAAPPQASEAGCTVA
jgi:glycosyltransferase involved in cell wall biosynthesis